MVNIELELDRSYDISFEMSLGKVRDSKETYNGFYEVSPSMDDQVLETKDKVMMKDLTINKIPYAEVSNPEGGQTVTIGVL